MKAISLFSGAGVRLSDEARVRMLHGWKRDY